MLTRGRDNESVRSGSVAVSCLLVDADVASRQPGIEADTSKLLNSTSHTSAQAEKIQTHAIATLRKGGAGGLALARGYSGLADIVYQSSSRRAPEALQHLRTAVAVW